MKNFLTNRFLPSAPIFILVIAIALANYEPNTLLTGWDNLHPEFNLSLNIKRSFFSVWQEYQSLGLLGGMGHAADIVRQFFLLLLSLLIPQFDLRYFWTILTLLIGGIGAVELSKALVKNSFLQDDKLNVLFVPAFTGILYMLNLATLQSYYVPFETFTSHFAFLPWMILATLHFFNRQSIKNAFILVLVFFITTPQSYVPTLFVVFTIATTVILAVAAIKLIKEKRIRKLISISVKYYAILLISNAFWLLPFLYFTITNASININAKINQMATEQIVLQNKEFGNIFDVMLLKGFWFNAIEPNLSRIPSYLLEPWRIHLSSPLIASIGFILFALAIIGLFNALRKKEILLVSFSVLLIIVFSILCSETFPFSLINKGFTSLPLFSQAFRFPFTKLSILAALLYAIFASFGLGTILIFLKNKLLKVFLISLLPIGILFYMLPVFRGDFFYNKEQLKLPKEYSQVFSFFDKKDPTHRIATLPMASFWGWNYYSWGYSGSGFLWYGIKQPIVDRAFDVWGVTSENSYNELSHALYSKNKEDLLRVLNKFQISYLVLDKNIYSNTSPKSLFYNETEEILKEIPGIKREATFGKIEIYKVDLKSKPNNFVFSTPLLPSSNEVTFNNLDTAYKSLGNYKSSTNPSNYYPFSSLYTNKLQLDKFKVSEKGNEITLTSSLPKVDSYTLILPDLKTEKVVPVEIVSTFDPITETSLVSAKVLFPKVSLGNQTLIDNKITLYPLFVAPANATYSLAVNNVRVTNINLSKLQSLITFLQLENDNYFTLADQNSGVQYVQTITSEYLNSLEGLSKKTLTLRGVSKGTPLSISFTKVTDSFYGYSFAGSNFENSKDCNEFRNGDIQIIKDSKNLTLKSMDDSSCTSTNASTLPHDSGYLIKTGTKHVSGRTLHFWILNENQGISPIDIYLDPKKETSYFVIPPTNDLGVGYSFHLDNVSLGNVSVENMLSQVEVSRIPYTYLTNISLSKPYTTYPSDVSLSVDHPNESLYIVQASNKSNNPYTIVLGQSFDSGWKAYNIEIGKNESNITKFLKQLFPFIFGKEVKGHVMINNWANGWEIQGSSQSQSFVIVYLPQYLQYAGFAALVLTLVSLIVAQLRKADPYFKDKIKELKRKIKSKTHR